MKVDLLPTFVSLKEDDVDLRYFLIASGNFSLVGRDTLESESEYERKVFIDDLEVPNKKKQTVSQLVNSIQRYFNTDKAVQISELCKKYESKRAGPALVVSEFQNILGTIKGFKFCWAYGLALTYGGGEIHKELQNVLREMKFKNEDCVLVRHGKSYRSIYKYLIRRLSEYLLEIKNTLESFPVEKINPMISSIYSHEVGDLIQGKYLQHYISARSLSVLMQIFFTDKTNYEDMFKDCVQRDLITVFIYWAIIKAKCNPTPGTTPGFRGVDWLREVEDTLDLSFIKVLTIEEQREKLMKKAIKENKQVNKEDFPTLNEEIGTQGNQKTLFELMHKSSKVEYQTYKKKGKKTSPVQSKPVEVSTRDTTASMGARGRGGKRVQTRADAWGNESDSEEEREKAAQRKKLELEYLQEMKQSEVKTEKNKPKQVEEFTNHFPKLDTAAAPKPIVNQQRLPLHMTSNTEKPKRKDDDDDFPTLGGGPSQGPNVLDEIKQGKKGPSKNKQTHQPPPPKKVHNPPVDASKSIVNLQPKKNEKETKDDFPSLGGGPLKQPNVIQKNEKPKEKEVQLPLYSTHHFQDAVTFEDEFEQVKPKKEKKKQTKLAAEDFPNFDMKGNVAPVYVSKYEARRNEILDIYEHLSPEEKALYGIGQGRNQLKPPTSKKFDDLEDEVEEKEQSQNIKKETKQPKPTSKKAEPEEDFPTFGDSQIKAKPVTIQPKDFTKAAAIEGSDIVITKKSKKKK